ncbi:MAG: diacylglycerol kinase family protein [Clostridia bacterium]|nr:diacylglycerol kinase family protein [Clostridia bacterium]
MKKGYVLYNSAAGEGGTEESFSFLDFVLDGKFIYLEISRIRNFRVFLEGLAKDDLLILCGGDGTLNRFVNETDLASFEGEILYYPCGTGNDFAADLGHSKGCDPFPVKKYLTDLPCVTVKGKTLRFINGVGFGIDGYCCEKGDRIKGAAAEKGKKKPKINYAAIAVSGLLFHFQPVNATVTVDGKRFSHQRVWLAPTMHGRCYGGGMIPTPKQDRTEGGTLSLMVFGGAGKLRTLGIFPSIFKGTHVLHSDAVHIYTGKSITVSFDRPTPLQIDGETVSEVTSYTAFVPEKKEPSEREIAEKACALFR